MGTPSTLCALAHTLELRITLEKPERQEVNPLRPLPGGTGYVLTNLLPR